MSFISFYVAGKLHTFSFPLDKQGCKIFVFVIPFTAAGLIGISRICDYHHHWQGIDTERRRYIISDSPFKNSKNSNTNILEPNVPEYLANFFFIALSAIFYNF